MVMPNNFKRGSRAFIALRDAQITVRDLETAVEEAENMMCSYLCGEIEDLEDENAELLEELKEITEANHRAFDYGRHAVLLALQSWVADQLKTLEEKIDVENKNSDSSAGTPGDAGAEISGD